MTILRVIKIINVFEMPHVLEVSQILSNLRIEKLHGIIEVAASMYNSTVVPKTSKLVDTILFLEACDKEKK